MRGKLEPSSSILPLRSPLAPDLRIDARLAGPVALSRVEVARSNEFGSCAVRVTSLRQKVTKQFASPGFILQTVFIRQAVDSPTGEIQRQLRISGGHRQFRPSLQVAWPT